MVKKGRWGSRCLIIFKNFGCAEWYIFLFLFVSVFAAVIANDQPLIRSCNGSFTFPFLKSHTVSRESKTAINCYSLRAIIPYSPDRSDPLNADFTGPFDEQWSMDNTGNTVKIPIRNRHWLGTNMRGNDLAAEIIYGTRISLFVSVLSTFFSFLIGGFLGFVAGWYGTERKRVSLLKLISGIAVLFLLWFFTINLLDTGDRIIGYAIVVAFSLIFYWIQRFFRNSAISKCHVFFSADHLIQRFSELFSAIPRIVFILSIVPLMEASFVTVIFILSITGWVDISRLLRSEILRLKKEGFIEAAKVSGIGQMRIFIVQILPNLWPSMMVILLYIFAGNIAAEASLSFLGFGLPVDVVTLGSLVASGKVYFEAWWMVVFPGVWISGFVFSLFSLSRKLRNRYELKNV